MKIIASNRVLLEGRTFDDPLAAIETTRAPTRVFLRHNLAMDNREKADAFDATDYQTILDGDACSIRIGRPAPAAVASWIDENAASGTAWIITGDNPGAAQDSPGRNDARRTLLAIWVDRPGIEAITSTHHASDGRWPDEHGLLIAGIDDALALSLGRRFGQAAIVAVSAHDVARLWWLE
ncbi:MAG: DUF3293 domain-containing protein [Salinisphaera sp.]|jgi:hypothetical protein|nr:DUF3293 domain-containing protein [Salinisphaera sp.]